MDRKFYVYYLHLQLASKLKAFFWQFLEFILISMLVAIWDMLPEILACSFVGFVTTRNMMQDLQRQTTPHPLQRFGDQSLQDKMSMEAATPQVGQVDE